jgi:GT2 family glycosyltransferase
VIDLSIVIVSFNTRDLLRNCLTSVAAGGGNLEVETFVVDNASADGSPDMVEREFPSVRLICNDVNRGFAAANNLAIEQATGRYLLLLNSDTEVQHDALRTLVRFMDQHPNAGYCGPRLINPDGSHQPSARRFPTVLSGAYSLLGLAGRRPESKHTLDLHASHSDRGEFRSGWLCGACVVVRAETARQVGLLDEGFFLYFEETDWCKRMAGAGWEGWFVGSAEVMHLGGQSVDSNGPAQPFSGDHPVHWVNSRRRYMRRYHGLPGMLLANAIEIVLYAAIWIRHSWRRGQRNRTKAQSAARAIRYMLAAPTATS